MNQEQRNAISEAVRAVRINSNGIHYTTYEGNLFFFSELDGVSMHLIAPAKTRPNSITLADLHPAKH